VNRAVHAASARKKVFSGVHNGVGFKMRNIAFKDPKRHVDSFALVS
jgi:hypothetical protein